MALHAATLTTTTKNTFIPLAIFIVLIV